MGFKTTFGFKFRNSLIHGQIAGAGGQSINGMNASIRSGSIAGSP